MEVFPLETACYRTLQRKSSEILILSHYRCHEFECPLRCFHAKGATHVARHLKTNIRKNIKHHTRYVPHAICAWRHFTSVWKVSYISESLFSNGMPRATCHIGVKAALCVVPLLFDSYCVVLIKCILWQHNHSCSTVCFDYLNKWNIFINLSIVQ